MLIFIASNQYMKRLLQLLSFFLFSKLYAQELFFNSPPNFQNLPSSETCHIFQDSKGIAWVCTKAGICRYDGSTLTTFTTKDGISENVVQRVYENDKKRMLIRLIRKNLLQLLLI
jgi:ligand-binding sensor domain-containing protein